MKITCEKCGYRFEKDDNNKYCPKCGTAYESYFIKNANKGRAAHIAIFIISFIVLLLGVSFLSWFYSPAGKIYRSYKSHNYDEAVEKAISTEGSRIQKGLLHLEFSTEKKKLLSQEDLTNNNQIEVGCLYKLEILTDEEYLSLNNLDRIGSIEEIDIVEIESESPWEKEGDNSQEKESDSMSASNSEDMAMASLDIEEETKNESETTLKETETEQESNMYIFPNSDSQFLTDADITDMDQETLWKGKNEIYARKGRKFNDDVLQEYFNSQPWYNPKYTPTEFDDNQTNMLNEFEMKNAEFLQNRGAVKP